MENITGSILSEADLVNLSIPVSDFPPYIEPFPQKESFTHLPSLKRVYIEKSLVRLYANCIFKTPVNVTVFTWILGDGLGDFSTQIEAGKILLETFPETSLISLHPANMPLCSPLPCPHFFTSYPEDGKGKWEPAALVDFPPQILETLSRSHAILQLPTYFPHTRSLMDKLGKNYELVGEAGWGDTPRFSPTSGSRALGLRSWEKGLFFSKFSFDSKEIQEPSLKEILAKIGKGKLCIGYLRTPKGCELLMQTFLTMEEEYSSDLILCLFPSEPLIRNVLSYTSFFQKKGISEIKIYYENTLCSIPIREKGKRLHIVQTKKINREDYLRLLLRSDLLVGCRGDSSLSEALSAGKIPFPDFPPHKKALLEGLVSAAIHKLGKTHPVTKYAEEFLNDTPDPAVLGTLLKTKIIERGFSTLLVFLQEYYNAGDFLKNLTLRAACHQLYPGIRILEKQILDGFLFGEKAAFEALAEIRKELSFIQNQ